jgi:hypothetical protein
VKVPKEPRKVDPLLATSPTVTTTLPVVAAVGTSATIEGALQLVGVAVIPSNVSLRAFIKRHQLEVVPSRKRSLRVGTRERHATETRPRAALRILQVQLDPALRVGTPEKDENKLYEQWTTAAHPDRTRLEKQLGLKAIAKAAKKQRS